MTRLLATILTVALAGVLFACGGSGGGATDRAARSGEACSGSSCVTDSPPQEPTAVTCTADADCPRVETPCATCADGSLACPQAVCDAGQCNVTMHACPEPSGCGGIGAIPCPADYACVDVPNDDCDPREGADCPGICVPEMKPAACGGITGGVCPSGEECVDDPSDSCDPAGNGADCPGLCQPTTNPECDDDSDCPPLRAPCSVCADGTPACPSSGCKEGRCYVAMPGCPPPVGCGSAGEECKPGYHCVSSADNCDPNTAVGCTSTCVPDDPSRVCGGVVGNTCPTGYACIDNPADDCDPATGADCPGVCQLEQPPMCSSDADCPHVLAPCTECRDGSYTCPEAYCQNGQCSVVIKPCAGTAECGGASGATCPPGLHCADIPGDACDPANGYVDCPGTCVKDEAPQCSSDAECPRILAPCRLCGDGNYACPESYCRDGQCVAVVNSCPAPGFCGGIAGFPCPAGLVCIDNPDDNCDPQKGGADCGGICVPDDKPRRCGGIVGDTCPPGYVCTDDPDDCDPANGGADCPGSCTPAPTPQCRSDGDCAAIAECRPCDDGTFSCAAALCRDGKCEVEYPGCSSAP